MDDRMDASTEEQGMADGPQAEKVNEPLPRSQEEIDAAKRRSRTRAATLSILAIIIVAAGAALIVANVDRPNDPTVVPQEWERADLDGAESIDLGDGRFPTVIVISAGDETCWNAYIVDQPLEGCGNKTFSVEGADPTVGVNVTSTASTKNFLGLAVWDANAQRLIDSAKTRKPFGTVALTVSLGLQ